ncbi:MAG: glycosyltransferase family 9 protein [Opitutales bacterium]
MIIKPSSLGDIIHGLQVAQALKRQIPDTHITWVAREVFVPFVEECSAVDRVLSFDRKGGAFAFWKLVRIIRNETYDCVLDLQGLARSGIMAFFARSSRKFGRRDAREGAGWFYTKKTSLPPGAEAVHALDILLGFCLLLGVEARSDGVLGFRPSKALPFPAIRNGEKPILVFPGSRRAEKVWEGFPELTRLLLDRAPGNVVVWAGDEPKATPSAFPGKRFHNLTGQTSLSELPALVAQSRWVIANDSGPMHLGAALGIPTLGIFGPTDPACFGPYPLKAPNNGVVRAPDGNLGQLEVDAVFRKFVEMEELDTGRQAQG